MKSDLVAFRTDLRLDMARLAVGATAFNLLATAAMVYVLIKLQAV